MKFTVFRDSWARGASDGQLYADGERCCLGFLGLACGLSDEDMDGIGTPQNVKPPAWPKTLVASVLDEEGEYTDSYLCGQIISTNDDEELEDPEREARLRSLFASGGIEVEFQDGVGP